LTGRVDGPSTRVVETGLNCSSSGNINNDDDDDNLSKSI